MTAYFYLRETDIQYMELNDKIRIDNSWWSINKIIDYNANDSSPTKVELISLETEIDLPPFSSPIGEPVGPGNGTQIQSIMDSYRSTTNDLIGGTANFFPADSKSKFTNGILKNFTIEFFLRWPSFPNTTYSFDSFQLYCSNIPNFAGLSDLEIKIQRGVDPSGIDFRYVTIIVQSPYYPPSGSL